MSHMRPFELARPRRLDAALDALAATPDSVPLAGGTDLLNRMKDGVTRPRRLVTLADLVELQDFADSSDGLTLGAGVTLARIVESPMIRHQYPALWQAAAEIASPAIRNTATLGGNLLQRPRCWYYRAGFGLLAQRDGQSLVRQGDNRYHAIFLTDSPALFVNPSSLAPALVALDAEAEVVNAKGTRTVKLADLYQVPKTERDSEFTLQPGDILARVRVPKPGLNASYEIRWKRSADWPLVLASVHLKLDGETIARARVALHGVAPIPWRSKTAEEVLVGRPATPETFNRAAQAAILGAQPLSRNAYKLTLVQTAVRRALLIAVGQPVPEV
ncbi:molybdopterin dehydrogenase FAD-binding protein [Isosphaera pallida ATCC 43644]|uniref:Molybdopterin dehydrogenase FAD-binding protein n=1 Tax=Isosphaera pallida (strain ATCC 43644 / DSM 9630 / IS1B) TaxID=575540 RepID=E8R1L6_ISOPI|nr:FAD binding domain-containing protein [Isosphaera pallida]ADV63434.1 molybdopterin dehydrogenase FAD-binding protein [Isosphaera pallida ATCC 43644]